MTAMDSLGVGLQKVGQVLLCLTELLEVSKRDPASEQSVIDDRMVGEIGDDLSERFGGGLVLFSLHLRPSLAVSREGDQCGVPLRFQDRFKLANRFFKFTCA